VEIRYGLFAADAPLVPFSLARERLG